jgi:uncharacterized protein (TIGR02453 family)
MKTPAVPRTAIDADLFPPFDGFPAEGLTFLSRLKKNNTRAWFTKHKPEYEEYVKMPMHSLIASLQQPMLAIAPEINVDTKKSMFRIYRDTRFSNDKTPYKTHVAAVFHPRGHWEASAGFYVHIEPKIIYAGGGIYMPDGAQLKAVRRAIAEQEREFLAIVRDKGFVRKFKGLEGEKLQRAPMGYPVDHPMIEWLKHKSFYTGVEWNVAECRTAKFIDRITGVYRDLLTLVRFLNNALFRKG